MGFATVRYRLIDHTADLGLHIFGRDPKDLFENAARAMFAQIVAPAGLRSEKRVLIRLEGADRPDLMVNWLRELLYFWTGKGLLLSAVTVSELSETQIAAEAFFDSYDPGRHELRKEIKAVTYHQIQVQSGPKGWEARVIFDV